MFIQLVVSLVTIILCWTLLHRVIANVLQYCRLLNFPRCIITTKNYVCYLHIFYFC